MKKILYVTDCEMPYKTKFFNELSKKCDLQVLYEFDSNKIRNTKWRKSIKPSFKHRFLQEYHKNIFKIIRIIREYIKNGYDTIVFGCINRKNEALLIRFFRKKANVYINLDGEIYLNKGCKKYLKKYVLSGVKGYISAGIIAAENLRKSLKKDNVYSYHFSSLTKKESNDNNKKYKKVKREEYFLIVSRYSKEKGIDIVFEVAKRHPDIIFKFVGMGNKASIFADKVKKEKLKNIVVIPFLQRKELDEEYLKCRALILPSIQECWGLVINEAASFGTPIISTYGSGAAVDFLKPKYSKFLSETNNVDSLDKCINIFLSSNKISNYSQYILEKSKEYTIETMTKEYLNALGLSKNKSSSIKDTKAAQMDLLKELKRICIENNIKYFLQYGTLLGAIRHDGFIPWDDDIDIGMFREDYEKFRECCKKQLNRDFYLADYRDTENYPHVFGKLKIKNTKYVEDLSKSSAMSSEIFIDIFPYDNAPNLKFIRRIRNIKYTIYKRILELKCGFNLTTTFKRKIKYIPIIVLSKLLTRKHCIKVFNKGLTKYNKKETKYVANCGGPAIYKAEVFPKEYISKVGLHKYEDSEFNIPIEYDNLLKHFYGDYMKLPPVEERIGKHKVIEIDLGNYKPKSKIKRN